MKLIQGDCLKEMAGISGQPIDMVMVDPPYGTTACKWDSIIPLGPMWDQLKRIVKPRGAIVLMASQPFTSALVSSNYPMFKYCWVWDKVNKFSGHLNAKKQPLRITEEVLVFYQKPPTYNPQMEAGVPYTATSHGRKSDNYGSQKDLVKTVNQGQYYPKNLLSILGDQRGSEGRIHPTQKPVALMEYMIKTYTNEGEVVLDFAMGSGTTGVACRNLGREFIGIELDPDYFRMAQERIEGTQPKLRKK